ncbi:SRPBCC family protein [Puerhibacterium sp. TATVAM-FAB25]|uniref:SRPBCC family protein n=1 Tax=Puerhibacterium sp. TATVAM-FAB25 TaxID=3093699 RepID=UPI00397D7A19
MDLAAAVRSPALARARDAAVVIGEYAAETLWAVTHPEWRRSGATRREEAEPLPGDGLVPEPNWAATRAQTVPAPPAQTWPWVAQMGYGRGGWYGDFPWWRDPAGHRGPRSAADRVVPGFQRVAVGDVLLDGPGCSAEVGAWYVRDVRPGRHLVLYSSRTLSGRELAFLRRRPRSWFDCSWAFVLHPAPEGGTRLLVRTRVRYHPGWVLPLLSVVRAGDTVMQRAMLAGLARRAAQEPGPTGDGAVGG